MTEQEKLALEKQKLELEQQTLELEEEEFQAAQASNPEEIDPQQKLKAMNRPVDAAMAGLGDTFELGDEMGAGVQKLLNMLPGSPAKVDAQMRAQGFTGEAISPKSYDDEVAENQAERNALYDQNKAAYIASKGIGMLATIPATVSKAAPLLGLPGKVIGKAIPGIGMATEAAVLGGAAAAGTSEGTLAQDPLKLFGDVADGMTVGGLTGGVASKGADKLADSKELLEKKAALSALRAMGINPKDVKGMSVPEMTELGRKILDEKLITPFSKKGESFGKLRGKIDSQEAVLMNTLRKIQESGVTPTNKKELADQITKDFLSKYKSAPDSEVGGAISKINDWVGLPKPVKPSGLDLPEGLTPDGIGQVPVEDVSPSLFVDDLQNKKVTLNHFIKDAGFSNQNPGMLLDTYRNLRSGFRGAIEKQADEASDPLKAILPTDEALNIKGVNKDLGQLYKLEDVAERENLKTLLGKQGLSPVEQGSIIASMMSGSPTAALTGGALKTARTYGDNIAALSRDKAAKMVGKAAPVVQATGNMAARLQGANTAEDETTQGNVKELSQMEAPQFQMLSEQALAMGDEKSKELAELLNITAQKTGIAKTASLFKIMQNPEYRQRLNELNKK